MMTNMKAVANNLERIMNEKGYTQTELANASGVSRIAINHWLRHYNLPRLDMIAMIARALGVPVDTLLEGLIEA